MSYVILVIAFIALIHSTLDNTVDPREPQARPIHVSASLDIGVRVHVRVCFCFRQCPPFPLTQCAIHSVTISY